MIATNNQLSKLCKDLWAESTSRYPKSSLSGFRTFLAIVCGNEKPPRGDGVRAFHPNLYWPDLPGRPWLEPVQFNLSRQLESRFDLVYEESLRLILSPWLFRSHPEASVQTAWE